MDSFVEGRIFKAAKFRTGEFLLHKKFPSSFRTIYRSSLKIDRKDTQIFGDKKIFLVIRRTDWTVEDLMYQKWFDDEKKGRITSKWIIYSRRWDFTDALDSLKTFHNLATLSIPIRIRLGFIHVFQMHALKNGHLLGLPGKFANISGNKTCNSCYRSKYTRIFLDNRKKEFKLNKLNSFFRIFYTNDYFLLIIAV